MKLFYLFLPPVYDDLESTHKSGFLHYSFMVVGLAFLIIGILNINWGADTLGIALIIFAGICVLGYLLNKAKYYIFSALILTLLLFAGVYFNLVDGAAFHDPGIAALPILIILTGILFKKRLIPVLTGISILGLILIYILWDNGFLGLNTPPTQNRLIILASLQAVTGILTWMAITTYQNTIDTINRSEERYKDLVENQIDLIYRMELNPEPKYTYVSPSAVKITGFSPLDYYLDPDMGSKLVHPDDQSKFEMLMAGKLDLEAPLVLRWIKKDKTKIWVEIKSLPIFNSSGEVIAIEGIARDITAQKEAEEKLVENDLRNRLILESLPMAFYRARAIGDLNAIWVSEQIDQISGYSPGEMTQPGFWRSKLHPEDLERSLFLTDSLSKFEPMMREYRWEKPDGSYIWIQDNGVVLFNENDQPDEIIGTWTDITARKEAEDALRSSEDRYRTIFEHAAVGISIHAEEQFIDVNQAWQDMFMRRKEEVIGKTPFDYSPEFQPDGRSSREKGTELLAKAKSGADQYFDWRHTRSNGSEFDTEIVMTIFKLSGEEVMISFVRDLTDRKLAEKAALEERQRLAHELHDAVSQTLFSASMIAQTLGRNWEGNPQQTSENLKELEILTRGAQAEMRNLLLELRPGNLEHIPMPDLIQQLAAGFSGRTKTEIEVNIDYDHPLPSAVRRVFFRLVQEALNNIIKHARAEKVMLLYNSTPEMVELMIEDDGRGFLTDNIAPGRHGLEIMRERAEGIHATIEISSMIDQGTTVRIIWRSRDGDQ